MGRTKIYHFRCHVPNLLQEIGLLRLEGIGILKVPLNIFQGYLVKVAQRAIELDDPELNILMLEMAMYEGTPAGLLKAIRVQKKRIKERNLSGKNKNRKITAPSS